MSTTRSKVAARKENPTPASRKIEIVKWTIPVILVAVLASFCLAADKSADQNNKNEKQKPAQSIAELQQQLEKILKETHTPGLSVAIVHRYGPEWVAGLGIADVASGRATTADTLFRIGSTSKAFASLSILMLADQGRLSLQDPVHNLAPDVWFENRWEAGDPIRVVNLLEHTTGWDDMHLREYAKDAPGMTLREGLDYDHHSRTSRWRPGTRMAYCNSGPPVAAYIVEKLTGERFEDYVQQHLFLPIGMKTATYFQPAPGTATTLYHTDGKTPYRYWNILLRPAGSINASANDMAAYVQFYLNRGAVRGKTIVPTSDLDRMEIPESTWAAKDGMKYGYGLSNYWSVAGGFVYHGHDGGVEGGLTEMAYMADYNVGYFFSINAGNGHAFERVAKAIRAYATKNLQRPPLPAIAELPAGARDYAGWYVPDSPRVELLHFVERLVGVTRLRFRDGKALLDHLGAWHDTYLPVERAQFRHVPKKKDDAPDPVATFELLSPNDEGRFVQVGMGMTMKRIPAWLAIGQIIATIYLLISIVAILLYAPFWILGGLSRKRRRRAERGLRLWPLIAVLSLIAFVGIFILSAGDLIERLGNLTGWSAALFLATVTFGIASLGSAISLWKTPAQNVRRAVRRFSLAVTLALLIAAVYLAYWGIIGLRTWA
jgi:CubicO group peptidase (beta-lactamase class C family)